MGNWLVNENPHEGGCREFELAYQECFETLTKRFLRVWDDGRIEIGIRDSPFTVHWQEQVLQDDTLRLHNLRVLRDGLRGI